MLPTLSWIDFSDSDRRRMVDVIRRLGDRETRDELGIGSIRDALADTLFPGTSTIQTRAKYFLFVAWHYQRREEMQTSGKDISRRLHDDEMALLAALKQSDDCDDKVGVIGIDAGQSLL